MAYSNVWSVSLPSRAYSGLGFHEPELALLSGRFPAFALEFASQMTDFHVNFIVHDMDAGALPAIHAVVETGYAINKRQHHGL
ncbi:hypothetical protein C8Q80DRAFT_1127606 [Daedaleopsis nitida]|nr:hypothetical protein C8Q80DRAFT_1127606 [Daedaleopsis nitida]